MELTSEQQRVMDVAIRASMFGQIYMKDVYAAGAALLAHEKALWMRDGAGERKENMRMTIAGLELTHGEDGFWLHFDGGNKKGAIHLENTFKFNILHDAVMQWANSQTEIDMNMLAAPSERNTLVALLESYRKSHSSCTGIGVALGEGRVSGENRCTVCQAFDSLTAAQPSSAPAEGAKAEGQAQPLKVAFKRSNRVTANQQAFEDAEYAAPRAESQDTVKHTPWRTEAMTAALASANAARDEQWEQALCEELPDDSIELIERICARVTAQGKETNHG